MRVLIAAASKHGSTLEIAKYIGQDLITFDFDVDVSPLPADINLLSYDAVILGSGVYVGNWLKSARQFIENNARTLSIMPVWLFSSGPIGKPLKPEIDKSVNIDKLLRQINPRQHVVFGGKLDKDSLNLGERALVSALHAEYGDYRNWGDIARWVSAVAVELDAITADNSSHLVSHHP